MNFITEFIEKEVCDHQDPEYIFVNVYHSSGVQVLFVMIAGAPKADVTIRCSGCIIQIETKRTGVHSIIPIPTAEETIGCL